MEVGRVRGAPSYATVVCQWCEEVGIEDVLTDTVGLAETGVDTARWAACLGDSTKEVTCSGLVHLNNNLRGLLAWIGLLRWIHLHRNAGR